MKNTIDKLIKEKEEITERLKKINTVINGIQELCSHTKEDGKSAIEYEGSASHKDYYKCTICGYKSWR